MTFLFDIGNVLLKLHFHRFHLAILGSDNVPLPADLANLKDSYETGRLSDQEFIEQSLDILNHPLTSDEFVAAWEDIFSLNLPMWEIVHTLKKQGHRLILFSNTNTIHARSFLKTYQDFDLFDHHHFSQEIGTIKPLPEFYQSAIDRYDLVPSETFYLDDLPENIASGEKFGFPSWQYDLNDHEACITWLKAQGINLSKFS
ncbi:MAG: HAD family hydrolase [Akkermansiaceae bacterium]